jgi:hypothetical protein
MENKFNSEDLENILDEITKVSFYDSGEELIYLQSIKEVFENYIEKSKNKITNEDYAIRFSNWLDKNYIKKKGVYYHKGDWEFSNGENNKKKLISIFNRSVALK